MRVQVTKGLLSVIVAVYNVKSYLAECINSICNQTYSDMEIILIDDGSNDGSGDICDSYARKDSRIRVIHQENKGLSGARNAGLDIMHGEYITIVDSDDYVLPNAFSEAISVIEKYNLDSCGFGAFRSGTGGDGTGNISLSLEEEHDARLRDCFTKEKTVNWGNVLKVLYGKIYDIQSTMYMKIVQLLIILLIEFNVVGLLIRNIIITEKTLQGYANPRQ